MRIPGLRGLRVRTVVKDTVEAFLEDDVPTYAAALAFRTLFALFPFLIFLVAAFSFLDAPGLFEWLLAQSGAFLPGDARAQVEQVIAEVEGRRQGGLLSFGILATLWMASAGVRTLMVALNQAYNVEEGRPWWKRWPLSVAYTFALGLLVVASTVLMVLGPRLTAWASDRLGLPDAVQAAIAWVRIPLAMLLATGAVVLVYRALPNVRQRLGLVVPGAVVAVLLWAATSFGFQLYVEHFGSFDATYGSIGAVVVLLTYLWFSGMVLLLGAELNAVIQHDAPRPGDAEPKEEAEEPADGTHPRSGKGWMG
jgi:membrane protein